MSQNVMNHLGQCVSDLDRSRTFYEQALGFTYWRSLELDDHPSDQLLQLQAPLGFRACYLRQGSFVLELLHFAGEGAAPGPFRPRPMNELADSGRFPARSPAVTISGKSSGRSAWVSW